MKKPPVSVYSEVPGKVFLLGEYAVLGGAPAWVAAVPPRFSATGEAPSQKEPRHGFHPRSPAARVLKGSVVSVDFIDPHQGSGGFGGSTAEYLLAATARNHFDGGRSPRFADLWRDYRAMSKQEGALAPSGADLAAQFLGGIVRFQIENGEPVAVPASARLAAFEWVVVSAVGRPDRKIRTYEELARSATAEAAKDLALRSILAQWELEASLPEPSSAGLGACLREYAERLNQLGLEHPDAKEERLVFSKMEEVAGYKGCGAMLSDAGIALLRSAEAVKPFEQEAKKLGLRVIHQGQLNEPGWKIS